MDRLSAEPSNVPFPLAPGPARRGPVRVRASLAFPLGVTDARAKLLVLGLWQIVPVLGFLALSGYRAEVMRRLGSNHPEPMPMPRLRDFAHYLRRGWAAALLELGGLGGLGLLIGSLVVAINAGLLAAWLSGTALSAVLVVGALVLLTSSAAFALWLHSALSEAELTGRLSLSPALLRRTWLSALRAYALFVPSSLLLLGLGVLTCGVGLLPALALVGLSASHLRWQLYEAHLQRGGSPLTQGPPRLLPSEQRLLPPKKKP